MRNLRRLAGRVARRAKRMIHRDAGFPRWLLRTPMFSRLLPQRLHAWTFRGLVSIVVPSYNVEEYLAECLDSLRAQTWRDIDIIVVVDGATDRTEEIASDYARRDRRIRVHVQPNAGLSAARNVGAGMARGEFLWFLDSDDKAMPRAAETAVTSLRTSGSDFAVLCYRRFNSTRHWNAMRWIRLAHDGLRRGISPRENPEVQVNAVAWSKIYRRSFWTAHDFAFPVGALYEDQPVSARAYALAKKIDMLPEVLIDWRARDDGSSISQQGHTLRDVTARITSATNSLNILRDHDAAELATVRAVQLLANDMPHSMKFLADADDAFLQELSRGLREISRELPAAAWRDIPAHHAALQHLLIAEDFERVREFVARGGQEAQRWPTVRRAGHVILQVPFYDDLDVALSADVLALAPRQRMPVVIAYEARWQAPGVLAVRGLARPNLMDPAQMDGPATMRLVALPAQGPAEGSLGAPAQGPAGGPSEASAQRPAGDPSGAPAHSMTIDAELTATTPHSVPLVVQQVTAAVDNPELERAYDYQSCGFETVIDIDALGLRAGHTYAIMVALDAGGQQDETPLFRVEKGLTAALGVSTAPSGVTAKLKRVDNLRMGLVLDRDDALSAGGSRP